MPGMDGSETFKSLKKNPITERIPVIFLTVQGMFEEFDNLRAMGALAVLTKPFDPTLLTSQITEILNNSLENKEAEATGGEAGGNGSVDSVHTDNTD